MTEPEKFYLELIRTGVIIFRDGDIINTLTGNAVGKITPATKNKSFVAFRNSLKDGAKHVEIQKHRLLWLIWHGEIPENTNVIPIDGNFLSTDVNNYKLVGRKIYKNKKRKKPGAAVSYSKLTEEQVTIARRDYRLGHRSVREMAREFNVKHPTLLAAIRGRSWRQVSEPPVIGEPEAYKKRRGNVDNLIKFWERRRLENKNKQPKPKLRVCNSKPKSLETKMIVNKPNAPKPETVITPNPVPSDFTKDIQAIQLLRRRGVDPEEIVETLLDRKTRMPIEEIRKLAKAA